MEYTTAKQAREALNKLIVQQQNATEKMNQFEAKVEEVKKIQKSWWKLKTNLFNRSAMIRSFHAIVMKTDPLY